MPNLSIKNVPEELLTQLRERAQEHNRTLQGELMAILEDAVGSKPTTIDEVYQQVKELGIQTDSGSAAMV